MVMAVNMQVNLGGLVMANPVTDASGTFAAGREYADFVDVAAFGRGYHQGRFARTAGWATNRRAHRGDSLRACSNSIGLQNPGVEHLMRRRDLPLA